MYCVRCYPALWCAPAVPRPCWLVDPAQGLGCSSLPSEAARFTLDEVVRLGPTLNTGTAVGTATAFRDLWVWEVVPEEEAADLPLLEACA